MNPLDEYFQLPLDNKIVQAPKGGPYKPLRGSLDTYAYYNSDTYNRHSLKDHPRR